MSITIWFGDVLTMYVVVAFPDAAMREGSCRLAPVFGCRLAPVFGCRLWDSVTQEDATLAFLELGGRLEPWFDWAVLTYSLVDWRWSTGLPSHPGPPTLARRVSTKRTIDDCPPSPTHQPKAARTGTQWFSIEDDTDNDQLPPWCIKHGLFLESKKRHFNDHP
jgi:hypothetical protein